MSKIMRSLKYVEESLKRDWSGIIMHFSLAIFNYLFAGKEMDTVFMFSQEITIE